MFARNCPPTTSATDMSRMESYPSRQIRSPRSPYTWSECRSRRKPEPVEMRLAPSLHLPPNPHKTKARRSAPKFQEEQKESRAAATFSRTNEIPAPSQRPKPADCIDCREMSAVDAIP